MEEISIKVDVPPEFKNILKRTLAEAAEEFSRKAKLKKFNEIVSKSKLSEEDAIRLGREVNKSLHERYKRLFPELNLK